MDIYYNYIYLDPRKPGKYVYETMCFLYEPIYIGKGKNNRMYNHITYFKNKKYDKINSILYNKLQKIYNLDLEPIIISFNNSIDEMYVYNIEAQLINEIGTIDGETIKRGPLCNFCIDNRPPNHKGKSYYEIYGIEKAKEQLIKRAKLQQNVGGYFKNHKHSEETKKLISQKTTGILNGMYGKPHNDITKEKISLANKGKKSKNAKQYIIINDIINKKYLISGNDIIHFCNIFNLSKSTLDKRINSNVAPKYGKTKGWKLFHLEQIDLTQETEIISYTVGAFNQDIDEHDYNEFDF